MATISLLALDRTDWERVAEDPAIFARQHKVTLGAEPDLLRAVAKQTLILFDRTGVTTQPWEWVPCAGSGWRHHRGDLRLQGTPGHRGSGRDRLLYVPWVRGPRRCQCDGGGTRRSCHECRGSATAEGSHIAREKRLDSDSRENRFPAAWRGHRSRGRSGVARGTRPDCDALDFTSGGLTLA